VFYHEIGAARSVSTHCMCKNLCEGEIMYTILI